MTAVDMPEVREERRHMKTVTAFVGSARKQRGLTYAATRQFLDNLESFGDVQGRDRLL